MTRFGARPVSVDMTRGHALERTAPARTDKPFAIASSSQLSHQAVADRLSLAHWGPGHRIVVSALAGGTGRTTVTGLLATVLAERPFAHMWPPIALVEPSHRTLPSTARRWSLVASGAGEQQLREAADPDRSRAASRVHLLTGRSSARQDLDYSVVVVDAPVGLPSDLEWVADDPGASVLLVIRADSASLADAAEALVWMHDQALVTRRRVTVVINHGAGPGDRGSKAAATALGIRCAAVHSLPQHSALAPGRPLPSARGLPTVLGRCVARVCLDIWGQCLTDHAPPSL
jgi:Mrp family chromosome partitioning ATPase